eukprot:g2368.t1
MSGRNDFECDWKESMGTAFFTPPTPAPSRYDEAEDSLMCNFHSILGDPGRDALSFGHMPEVYNDTRSFIGRMPSTDESLANLQPVTKKLRCMDSPLYQLHSQVAPPASIWKLEDEAYGPRYPPQPPPTHHHHHYQNQLIPRKQTQLQSCPLPATLPYGDPPRSFLSTISSLDPFSEHSELSLHQTPYMACHSQSYELFDHAFSSPSESETLTTERIPKIEQLEPMFDRSMRKPSRAMLNPRRSFTRSKGVTMCLRTLLRQLLAGTGWIMDSSISKDQATRLIKSLIGKDLESNVKIELLPEHSERMTPEHKEHHFTSILPDLMSLYTGKLVTLEKSQEYIKRDKGPYHLTPEFSALLQNKPWPPVMESDVVLREYGCYRQGEASKRARTSSIDSVAHSIL